MTPAEKLTAEGYSLEAMLRHHELIDFIKPWLSVKYRVIKLFVFFNLVFLFLLVAVAGVFMLNSDGAAGDVFSHVAFGFALTIPLIPLHEVIHGLAYRLCGAKSVTYKANWRKLYFMAMADKFITSGKQFVFVGLAPFVVINLLLLLCSFLMPEPWNITFLSTLLVHSGMCAGDFALISYFDAARDREVVTFDDISKGETSFYSRRG